MRELAVVLAAIVTVLSLGNVFAEGSITVDSQTSENHFLKDIAFRLKATASQHITRVTLYYRVGNSTSYSYVYPTFAPGFAVEAEYALPTGGARYLVPGSEIEYYYEIEDAAGARLRTDPAKTVYEDTRFAWQKLDGAGVTVYHYDQQQAAEVALGAAEETMASMKASAGTALQRPARIYLYRSKQEMDVALPRLSEATTREVTWGGMAFPWVDEVIILGSSSALAEITAHELTHLLTAQLTDNPFSTIPTWLNEGLSMYAQGEMPGWGRQALGDAISRNTLLNLRTISSFPGKPENVGLFYAEADSLVHYLIETYGPDKMSQFLAAFKQGSTTNDALVKVYGLDIDGLEARWRSAIGAPSLASTGARQAAPPAAPAVPTIAPFGSKPVQSPAEPVEEAGARSKVQAGAAPYIAVAAGMLLLMAFWGLVMARRR